MKLLFSVAVSLALTAAPAMAQQKRLPAPLPDEVRLDNYLALAAIEAVQKDLGVGDDVARKLTLLKDECEAAISSAFQSAGITPLLGPGGAPSVPRQKIVEIRGRLINEFIAKATKMLSTDQIKRLQQIRLQGRLRTGPPAFLAPEVASELKLTDDQEQSLTALNSEMREKQFPGGAGAGGREFQERLRSVQEEYASKALEVLSAEQKEALNRLKGNEFDVSKLPRIISVATLPLPPTGTATAQRKSEGTIASGRIRPDSIVQLAANEAVQNDLGLSADVARKLMSLPRDYQRAETKAIQDAGYPDIQDQIRLRVREHQKYLEIAKKVQEDFLPQLKELLTEEQNKRFQQIQFQNRLNYDGPKALLAPEVASELKLYDDQKLLLDALSREFSRSGAFQFANGRGSVSFEKWVPHGKEYRAKVIELLTPEQKEALSQLEGQEFDLSAFVIYSTPPTPRK